jgi:hypothetical protein
MADWTIRIAQLPVTPLGARFNHNMIVVMDPSGRVVWELNGGPVGPDGKIIPFGDSRMALAYTSGQFPVGAEAHFGPYFYRSGLNERVVFSGTPEQVLERLQAADGCIKAINSAGERYSLFTGPRGGRDEPSNATFNSNSVNASLLQCMRLPADDPVISRQQGFDNPILPQDQVREIIEQQKPVAPPGGTPPADNIPIPRPQPQKRGDNWDGTNAPTFGQTALSVSSVPGEKAPADDSILDGQPPPRDEQPSVSIFADLIPRPAGPQLKRTDGQSPAYQQVTSTGGPGLPQHVIDAGNLLRANGYEITPRTMYVSHVLGPQAAVDLFNRTGSTASPAVPSPDAATGDQMRAWVRALRLGPAAQAGLVGGLAPAPDTGAATPGQPDDNMLAASRPFT